VQRAASGYAGDERATRAVTPVTLNYERARPLNRGGKIKLGETEMKLATPSSPAKEASLISQLYSGSRKPAGRS